MGGRGVFHERGRDGIEQAGGVTEKTLAVGAGGAKQICLVLVNEKIVRARKEQMRGFFAALRMTAPRSGMGRRVYERADG